MGKGSRGRRIRTVGKKEVTVYRHISQLIDVCIIILKFLQYHYFTA